MTTLLKDNSYLTSRDGKTIDGYIGPDATKCFIALSLGHGLKLYAESNGRIIPNRSWTPTKMLVAATNITGVKYKRGQQTQASIDVLRWANEMKSALPVVQS